MLVWLGCYLRLILRLFFLARIEIFLISINRDGELLVDNELTDLCNLRRFIIEFLDNGGVSQVVIIVKGFEK